MVSAIQTGGVAHEDYETDIKVVNYPTSVSIYLHFPEL